VRQDLKELSLFSETNKSQLSEIARQLTMLSVPAGKVLVREGDLGNEFMIIAEGEALVSQGGRVIATIGAGDLVGEMALLGERGRGRRNATVTAVTDGIIYVGSPSEFRRILDAAPSVAAKVRQTVESRTLRNAA
jgi:CRP/FNR family cyclic AMP-dependent transcriptional regulator